MILGENGLINKAQSSVNAYQQAALNEQNLLQSIEDYMGNYGLPDNTPTTPAGTHVKPPAKWLGTIVDAVADGKGNTFPVPKSFYYVGGDYTNGVIISDDQADAYDGTTDKTTWEYTTSLVGNQFVWIPCTVDEYHKTNWGSSYVLGGYDSDDANASEIIQIKKYNGFYVGRYEAGLANTIQESLTNISNASNSINNYNVEGIPQLKACKVPWTYIDYINSKNNAKNMYKNNLYVTSGLITGAQWDVMLNKFIGTTNESGLTFTVDEMTNSDSWGNYMTNSIEYTGRLAQIVSGKFKPFGNITTGKTKAYSNSSQASLNADILSTGASKITEAYHIYDVAGNAWEWTDEIGQGSNTHIVRASWGVGNGSGANAPACRRDGRYLANNKDARLGFRVVLYIE